MKTVAIIQARMGSTRLPGKVLLPLAGKPSIQHVIERAERICGVDEVILATSVHPGDTLLSDFCRSRGIQVVRGSESDVLDRYFQTAKAARADTVMRITGDCPLLDPVESAKVLDLFRSLDVEYVSNTNPPTLPDGLDTEVFRFHALEAAWENAVKPAEREHVTLHIYSRPSQFRIKNLLNAVDLSGQRWTLDNENDYKMLSAVYDELTQREQFGFLKEVLAILEAHPEIKKLNSGTIRNEGLMKSLERDLHD